MSTGIFTTTTANNTTDFVKKSFAGMITRLMPNGSAPLFALTSMLSTEVAASFEHGFFTKTMVFPSVTAGAANQAAGITNLVVTATTNILPGMILGTGLFGSENIIVNAVVSDTILSVTRGVGTIAAAQIDANTVLYQLGNAFEEASLRPTALAINPVRVTNYTQIFRNTWAISDSARATAVIAGDTNVAENKQDCAAFHAADIEKAIFFGQKSTGSRNGQPFRTMDGLINQIEGTSSGTYVAGGNTWQAGATTTYAQLEGYLDPVFDQVTDPKGGNERLLFVGSQALTVINGIGKLYGTYQIVDGATSFGMQFRTFRTTRGTFRMIEHPLLNSNAVWKKMAVAVDLSTFNLAYLGDRKTQHKEFNADSDANDNGIDAVGGTLTTELTTIVKNPGANAVVTNLTAAA